MLVLIAVCLIALGDTC